MTSNKVYSFLALPDVDHDNTITILLTIYKYGIAEIQSDMTSLRALAAADLLKVKLARNHSACMLTETGASWVNKYFFKILTECPLYTIWPAIVVNDEIQLLKDLSKEVSSNQPSFSGPSMTMDRGRYFLQQITKGRVTLVDDCDVPYHVNLNNIAKVLMFRSAKIFG